MHDRERQANSRRALTAHAPLEGPHCTCPAGGCAGAEATYLSRAVFMSPNFHYTPKPLHLQTLCHNVLQMIPFTWKPAQLF